MAEIDTGLIKRNIQRMIDAGAPESDIDAYVASEGATPDMLRAAPPAAAPPASPDVVPGGHGVPSRVTVRPRHPSSPDSVRPMIGVQGAGRGVADTVATPFDIADMGANALLALVDKGSRLMGGPEVPYRFPLVSDEIANNTSALASKVGVPVVDQNQMNWRERTAYNINRFGTQGALSAGVLAPVAAARFGSTAARTMPRFGDSFLRPYISSPTKTAVGDTVAGAGGGTALTASQSVPDKVRESGGGSVGAISDLISMLLGALGGGTISGTAMHGPGYVKQRFTGSLPDPNIPLDPKTNLPTSRRMADTTAKYVQSESVNPAEAAKNIETGANDFHSMDAPVPTAGILSRDPKLVALERAQRRSDPGTFEVSDRAIRDAAKDTVEGIQPQNVNPRDATDYFNSEAASRTSAAESALQSARTMHTAADTAERTVADTLRPYAGRGADASAALDSLIIDKSLRPMDTARKADFAAIPREVTVPGEPFAQRAQDIRQAAEHLPKNARSEVLPEKRLQDVESYVERDADGKIIGVKPIPFGTINDMRPIISAEIARARAEGLPPTYIDNLEALRREFNAATNNLPEAKSALDRFHSIYAPVWGRGSGSAYGFRQDFNVDRTNRTASPPTTTASRFLGKNEGAKEKAQALSRIVSSMADQTDQAATLEAVRRYVLDDISRTIGPNGKIQPQLLARWLNGKGGWSDALSQFPAVRAEMDKLLRDVQAGKAASNDTALAVETAQKNVKRTQDEINNSALSLVLGREPRKAARSVLESRDPQMAMRDIKRLIGRNKQASDAWERSVADYLVQKVSNVDPGSATVGAQSLDYAKLVRTFDQYSGALAELYAGQPNKMAALRRAQKMLEPLARVPGSATASAPNMPGHEAAWRALEIGLKTMFGILEGGGRLRTIRIAVKDIGDNENEIIQLVNRMMFDPELAAHLLTRKTSDVLAPAWNDKLAKLLRRVQAGRAVWGDNNNADQK